MTRRQRCNAYRIRIFLKKKALLAEGFEQALNWHENLVVKNCALSRFRYKDTEGLRGRESTDNGQKRGSRWISKAFGTNILQSCTSFSGFISSGKRTRRSEYSPARCSSPHRGRFWGCAGRTVTKIRARGGKTRNGDPPPRPTTNHAGEPCTNKKNADSHGS